MCISHRALCFTGVKPSSNHLDDHLYTPLPVAYLEPGMTSLGDDVSDDDVSEGELRGAVRVRYTASGCCVSPVRVAASSAGVKLGRDARPPTDKLRRLLCCHKRDKVLLKHHLINYLYQHFMPCADQAALSSVNTCEQF